MSAGRYCGRHGDALVIEPGGPDMPTIHGRAYCPTCRELLMGALETLPGEVTHDAR